MNMHDIPDHELDALFRRSVGDSDIPFDERAWQDLEKKLKAYKKQTWKKRVAFLIVAVSLIAVTGTVLVTFMHSSENDKSSQLENSRYRQDFRKNDSVNTRNLAEKTGVTATEATISQAHKMRSEKRYLRFSDESGKYDPIMHDDLDSVETGMNFLSAYERFTEKNPDSYRNDNAWEYPPSDESNILDKSGRNVQNSGRKNRVFSEENSSDESWKVRSIDRKSHQNNNLSNSNQQYPNTRVTYDKEKSVGKQNRETYRLITNIPVGGKVRAEGFYSGTSSSRVTTDSLKGNNKLINATQNQDQKIFTVKHSSDKSNAEALPDTTSAKVMKKDTLQQEKYVADHYVDKEDRERLRRMSLGVFGSPDFSSVAYLKITKPGIALGIFTEYHFTKRWTVFLGVIRTSKIYSSPSHMYNATGSYWNKKNDADRIDGSCMILDVPINIKYHPIVREKDAAFLSTGLSSYFMREQEYSFVYSDNRSTTWSDYENENYYFGVLNLSIGYERFLTRSFSVQVEPFVKIPMSKIGDGEIKLLTTGMFFYLKYSIR